MIVITKLKLQIPVLDLIEFLTHSILQIVTVTKHFVDITLKLKTL